MRESVRAQVKLHGRDAPKIAAALQMALPVVERELAALFEGKSTATTPALTPVGHQPSPTSSKAFALLSQGKAMASVVSGVKRWDPIAKLPPELQERLTLGDVTRIKVAIGHLQQAVREHKLDYVPVFGYLSLRTHNAAELGKKSQDDVVIGKDVVPAVLPGFDVAVVASSVFRGTPDHPGAVAGLGKKAGTQTPGVMLKVPLDRADELLAVLLARELFAEADLYDHKSGASNAMYAPMVETVTLEDGSQVPSLVFATNEESFKAVDNKPDAFGDGNGLTVQRMAYLFAAQGGFVRDDGKAFGGPAIDYWENSYLAARKAAGQPVDETIAAAVELSKLYPQEDVVDKIMARTDRDAKLMQQAFLYLFKGVATPLNIHRAQKPATGLTREKQGTRGDDAEQRLLAKAKELARTGKI